MSIKVMTRVWDHADYSGSALVLLLALADYANDDGICWPKIPHLAQRARLSERQCQRTLEQLAADGAIAITARDGGRGKPSQFLVCAGLPPESEKPFTLPPPKGDAGDTVSEQKGDAGDTVSEQKGDIQGKERVTSRARKGDIQGRRQSAESGSPVAENAPEHRGIRHDPSWGDPPPHGGGGGPLLTWLLSKRFHPPNAEAIAALCEQQGVSLVRLQADFEARWSAGQRHGAICIAWKAHLPQDTDDANEQRRPPAPASSANGHVPPAVSPFDGLKRARVHRPAPPGTDSG